MLLVKMKITSTSSVVIYGSSLHLCGSLSARSVRCFSSYFFIIGYSSINNFPYFILLFSIDLRFGTQTFIFEISLFSPYSASSARHLWFHPFPSSSSSSSFHHLVVFIISSGLLWVFIIYGLLVAGCWWVLGGLNYIACSDRIRRLCIPLRYSILDYTLTFRPFDIYLQSSLSGFNDIIHLCLQSSIFRFFNYCRCLSLALLILFVLFTFILSLSSTAVCCFLC